MHDRKLVAGTKEYILVDVKDRLGEVENIGTLSPTYSVFDAEGVPLYDDEPATSEGMKIKCLIDTTVGTWPIGKYELYVRFQASPEIPLIGPVEWWLKSE